MDINGQLDMDVCDIFPSITLLNLTEYWMINFSFLCFSVAITFDKGE